MYNLIEERNRDFRRLCIEIINSHPGPISIPEVAKIAAESAAPRYYVSFDVARRTISLLRKGKLRILNLRRITQWKEIERKVRALEERGHATDRALSIVLAGAMASSFFISPIRARHIAAEAANREVKWDN